MLPHAEAAVWASISLQPPGRAGRQSLGAGAHLPRSRRAAGGAAAAAAAAALPRCPHGLRRGLAVGGSPRPGPRRGELVERDRRASPSRAGAGRRSRGPGWRRGRAGEVGWSDGAMLGGRAQGGERRGAGARRLAEKLALFFLYCSGSPARGFSTNRAVHTPSPRCPGFQARYGSDGAAAEWVMLIHWEFQRSAGLKLHGCLLLGGKVFKVLKEQLLPFAFKPCIKWTRVRSEAVWRRRLINVIICVKLESHLSSFSLILRRV